MVNQQVLEGQWNEIVGYIKGRWGQISDNELLQVKGDVRQLIGLIQEKTGWTKEKIETELNALVARGSSLADQATGAAQEFASHATESMQHSYEQVSSRVRDGYGQAEQVVQRRPIESIAVAFGSGLIAGVIVGLVLRSK